MARTWDARSPVLVASGALVPRTGTDQFLDFHTHPDHAYLAGEVQPGTVLAFDPREGWTLFVPVPTLEDRVWSGDGLPLDDVRTAAGLDTAVPIPALEGWLERRRGEAVVLLGDHDLAHHPARYGLANWDRLEVAIDHRASERCTEQLAEARRAKDPAEIDLMRAAGDSTAAGHLHALRSARPGMSERDLQIDVEAAFFRSGGARTAYGSLVGGGPNSSILHFAPTARPFRDGDLILMDAAAEVQGYAADVTRTFPAGRRYVGIHRDLYELVLSVQLAAIADARPGKEYRELHLEAAHRIAAGLTDLGILRGSPAGLVERDAHALFFPHGLGHMLGLSTHDAGGCLAGRAKSDRFGLKWLRADLPLQPGYVVTIEPGIYFIRALLTQPDWRAKYADCVDWTRVDGLLDIGGVRIEDDVLITDSGAEVLTAGIPKSIDAIEALRSEALAA
jgi:Xaa-Pro aminopeptidase